MRKLSKFELKALNSLSKIEIQEKNNAELYRLQKQNRTGKYFFKILISSIVIGSCSVGIYQYYSMNKKHTQTPIHAITKSNQSKYSYQKKSTKTTKRKSNSKPFVKKSKVKQSENGKIHYWTDENGTVRATNTGIPDNVSSFYVIDEINTFNKRTPVRIKNNSIYIPVTLSNNGTTITTEMLLDTGCSSTVINYKLAKRLKLKKLHSVKSIAADGRIIHGKKAKIDFIKVGPYSEQNLKISYQKHAGSANKGLLGMDFLKKHPFSIDFENKNVIWE